MKSLFGRLDRYIIKKFLGTFFFMLVLILSIAVVFDMTEKIDDFGENNAPIKAIIFDYYANFVPYFANLFTSLFVFISVIFFTSKMAYQTEIIAILASGVSFKRMMFPYFIGALTIAGFSFYLGSYVIPQSSATRLDFEDTYIKKRKTERPKNIHLQVSPNTFIYLYSYSEFQNRGNNFGVENFEGKTLKSKLTANSIVYKDDSTWTLNDYVIQTFNDEHEVSVIEGKKLDTIFDIKPSDFTVERKWFETMTNPELTKYIDQQTSRGVGSIEPFQIELYKRWANPFAAFILTLIGVAISSRKTRGGMGLHLGFGLALSFGYILFQTISTSLATGGGVNPMLAVWLPNIIYSVIAAYLYKKAPK